MGRVLRFEQHTPVQLKSEYPLGFCRQKGILYTHETGLFGSLVWKNSWKGILILDGSNTVKSVIKINWLLKTVFYQIFLLPIVLGKQMERISGVCSTLKMGGPRFFNSLNGVWLLVYKGAGEWLISPEWPTKVLISPKWPAKVVWPGPPAPFAHATDKGFMFQIKSTSVVLDLCCTNFFIIPIYEVQYVMIVGFGSKNK